MKYVIAFALIGLACWLMRRPLFAGRYMYRMIQELPLWTWYTLPQLVSGGFPRWACERLLPDFYATGMMRVRLRENPHAPLPDGFTAHDVRNHLSELEYCLVQRRLPDN